MNLRNILSTGAALGVIALSLGITPAFAQDTATTAADETAPPESAIIVTGSRSTTRTVANSPVPVDVFLGEMLTEGGQVETNKILNKLVPSFNFPQPASWRRRSEEHTSELQSL